MAGGLAADSCALLPHAVGRPCVLMQLWLLVEGEDLLRGFLDPKGHRAGGAVGCAVDAGPPERLGSVRLRQALRRRGRRRAAAAATAAAAAARRVPAQCTIGWRTVPLPPSTSTGPPSLLCVCAAAPLALIKEYKAGASDYDEWVKWGDEILVRPPPHSRLNKLPGRRGRASPARARVLQHHQPGIYSPLSPPTCPAPLVGAMRLAGAAARWPRWPVAPPPPPPPNNINDHPWPRRSPAFLPSLCAARWARWPST